MFVRISLIDNPFSPINDRQCLKTKEIELDQTYRFNIVLVELCDDLCAAILAVQCGEVGELATVSSRSGWLRDAQRFPVIIRFEDESAKGLRRVGGQVDVLVYTGDNRLINTLGRWWIRALSWLSYFY